MARIFPVWRSSTRMVGGRHGDDPMSNYADRTYRKGDPNCSKCEGRGVELFTHAHMIGGVPVGETLERRCPCTDIKPTGDQVNDRTAKWKCDECEETTAVLSRAQALEHKYKGSICPGRWHRVEEVATVTLWLECDCCGGNAAPFPVKDGDRLQCGCSGFVWCDEGDDGEPKAWTHDDVPCLNCRESSEEAAKREIPIADAESWRLAYVKADKERVEAIARLKQVEADWDAASAVYRRDHIRAESAEKEVASQARALESVRKAGLVFRVGNLEAKVKRHRAKLETARELFARLRNAFGVIKKSNRRDMWAMEVRELLSDIEAWGTKE